MTLMHNFSGDGARVLFFGRSGCDSTKSILDLLQNLGFDVSFVKSSGRSEKLPQDVLNWQGDYILCFRSLFILPKAVIDQANIAAVNFHPAPPEYPGSGCINFALYDNAHEYGVTAHLMNEKVDNGAILEVRRFPVSPSDDLPTVLAQTHSELLALCSDFANEISEKGEALIAEKMKASEHEKWNGKARLMKEMEALKTISPDVSEEELKRVIRATYIEGYPPKIELHGFQFYLRKDET